MNTCSWTSSISELSRRMKMGTAPALITILVCMEVPDAMFVKAHAASNCKTHMAIHKWASWSDNRFQNISSMEIHKYDAKQLPKSIQIVLCRWCLLIITHKLLCQVIILFLLLIFWMAVFKRKPKHMAKRDCGICSCMFGFKMVLFYIHIWATKLFVSSVQWVKMSAGGLRYIYVFNPYLKCPAALFLQELHKARDDACLNHFIYWGVRFWKQSDFWYNILPQFRLCDVIQIQSLCVGSSSVVSVRWLLVCMFGSNLFRSWVGIIVNSNTWMSLHTRHECNSDPFSQ